MYAYRPSYEHQNIQLFIVLSIFHTERTIIKSINSRNLYKLQILIKIYCSPQFWYTRSIESNHKNQYGNNSDKN